MLVRLRSEGDAEATLGLVSDGPAARVGGASRNKPPATGIGGVGVLASAIRYRGPVATAPAMCLGVQCKGAEKNSGQERRPCD